MYTLKRYIALIAGFLAAGVAVACYVAYAWPKGLNELSKSERDFMMLEPTMEICALFFVALRRSSTLAAIQLGAISRSEDLIQDTHGNIRMTEIMASLMVVLFRAVFRIYPSPMALADYALVTFATINFSINVYDSVTRRDGKH